MQFMTVHKTEMSYTSVKVSFVQEMPFGEMQHFKWFSSPTLLTYRFL